MSQKHILTSGEVARDVRHTLLAVIDSVELDLVGATWSQLP